MSTLNPDKIAAIALPPGWTCFIPEKMYHAESRAGRIMSSSMLREFRICPAHYRAMTSGAADKADVDALRFGRAVHKLVLEGEAGFRGAFAVGGPVNKSTGRSYGAGTRIFGQWLAESGLDKRSVVTGAEYDGMRRMRDAVWSHPEISRLFADGWPERSAHAVLEGVPCQIRLDWLRPDCIAVDLKTVDDISRFERDARRFGYLHQFAFYREAAKAAGGGELEMLAAVVEKKPPYRAGVWRFPAEALAPYAEQDRQALRAYSRCRVENRWPTGYEKPRNFPLAGIPPTWLN